MPPFVDSLKGRFRGTASLGAFLAATLALAAWLGYQAWDAALSQRRTAEAVLTDYAGIAAWEYSRAVRGDLDHLLGDAFRPVYRRLRNRLPSPEVAGWALDRAAAEQGCACPEFYQPIALFRYVEARRSVDIVPEELSSVAVGRLVRAILDRETGDGRVERGLITATEPELFDGPLAAGYMIAHDTLGGVEAAYGFVVPASSLEGLFREWYLGRQLLPPPVAEDQPNESLLYLRVRDPSGLTLFASNADPPEDWAGSDTVGTEYGGLIVDASVRPEAAAQLIIGGLPRSRLPLLAVLMFLTIGVGVAGLVVFRRELRLQRIREDFVSGVSHELRTPLAQIRMFAELQEAGKLVSEEDRVRAVSVISREARRLSHLVENILQFSRLRRRPGTGPPTEELDVADALADGIDLAKPLLTDRGMKLEVDAQEGLRVVANREAFTRIIVNLLDNAVKYGPRGQTVRLGAGRRNGSVHLSVADEGPGIPAQERNRIWEAYRRLQRDVESLVPGTGIGLSVVTNLATQQGGRAWVEDAERGGARFVVELPLADPGPGDREYGSPGR